MSTYHFTVVLEPDREEPHRYNVRVPVLPGCLTYGESIEDALKTLTIDPLPAGNTMLRNSMDSKTLSEYEWVK